MKIKKPYKFRFFKKYSDKYYDWITGVEFTYEEINQHPRWEKNEYDNNGNKIYYEDYLGYWVIHEYDNNGKIIYYENSNGYRSKREYNNNGNEIFFENSIGEWYKSEYDADGNRIYWEDSSGYIENNRR